MTKKSNMLYFSPSNQQEIKIITSCIRKTSSVPIEVSRSVRVLFPDKIMRGVCNLPAVPPPPKKTKISGCSLAKGKREYKYSKVLQMFFLKR
jgi:hypothetical protein